MAGYWDLLIAGIWTLGLIFSSRAMDWLGGQTYGRAYWFIVSPGVILHETSHWLACKITFTKVKEVKLMGREGGHVTHEKRNPIVNFIIGTAPFLGGALFLFLLAWLLLPGGLRSANLSGGLWTTVKSMLLAFKISFIDHSGYRKIGFYLFCYLAFTISATLSPSGQDMKNAFVGMVIFLAVLFILVFIQSQGYLPFWTGTPVMDFSLEVYLSAVGLGFTGTFLGLLFTLPIYLVKRAIY